MGNRLGVEHLTALGMPPPALVELAADAGLRSVGLHARRHEGASSGYPAWSLLDDAGLRRETRARMAGCGIALGLGDACHIAPDIDVSHWRQTVDVFMELGAERINLLCWEPDRARALDQFGKFADMTRAASVRMVYEYAPGRAFRRLDDVASAIAQLGPGYAGHVGLLIDCMHYFRGGHTVEDIARFDPALFGYVQFCDAPLKGEKHYLEEALRQRLLPGEGELPLQALLAALPRGIPVSIELPHQRLADAGVGPPERLRRAADAARDLLAAIEPRDAAGTESF